MRVRRLDRPPTQRVDVARARRGAHLNKLSKLRRASPWCAAVVSALCCSVPRVLCVSACAVVETLRADDDKTRSIVKLRRPPARRHLQRGEPWKQRSRYASTGCQAARFRAGLAGGGRRSGRSLLRGVVRPTQAEHVILLVWIKYVVVFSGLARCGGARNTTSWFACYSCCLSATRARVVC